MTEEAHFPLSKQTLYKVAAALVQRMRRRSDQLRTNRRLKLDHLFGLRAYGLVVYGALPASLGALGAFKPPDQTTLSSKIGFAALPYICGVAMIPVVLTYVLVRQRLANWYLLRDYLTLRSAAITLGIITISSLVCGANGLLVGTFKWLSVTEWRALSFADKAWPVGVCLLLSFAYLVGSSTLFLTVVKEDGNLPLLPDKDEVTNLASLRASLRNIAKSKIQSEFPKQSDVENVVTPLTTLVTTATDVLDNLNKGFVGMGREKFYDNLSSQLADLSAAATDVSQSVLTWRYYWDPTLDTTPLNADQRRRRRSIESLKGMRVDG